MSDSKFDLTGLKRVVSIALSYRLLFTSVVFIAILSATVSALRPYLVGSAIDNYILKFDKEGLISFILLIAAVLFIEVILQFFVIYLANSVAQKVIEYLRVRLFKHLIKFKLGYFDRTPNGVLVTRSVSDIETIAEVFNNGILVLLVDLLRVLFIIGIMYFMNWRLASIIILILPLMILVTNFFQRALKKVYQAERTITAQLNTFVQERLTGMSIVQLFNRQQSEYKKFESINKELRNAFLKTVMYFAMLFPVVDIVSSLAVGLLIWFGGLRAAVGDQISVGHVIAFISYINMLTQPMRQIADKFNSIQRGLIGADRVFKILDANETLVNNGSQVLKNVKGEIEFNNVQFSYIKNEPVLKGISFTSKPGKTIAIVGSTGAGKSTIINLLSRFYDIDAGDILIDKKSIYDIELSSLRKHIAVVLQDVFLFNTTIFENITLGDTSKTIEEVKAAAKKIGIHDFIESLPNGYYAEVSERGGTLSVGQRQLISFLRAYIYNPQILVLDEATSSIDTESEELIQIATEKLTQGRTSIVIAHRLATIQSADMILVMEKGEIVERGTHHELLGQKGYYYNLHEVQFSNNQS